jgi:hypothetical protein
LAERAERAPRPPGVADAKTRRHRAERNAISVVIESSVGATPSIVSAAYSLARIPNDEPERRIPNDEFEYRI